MTSGKSVNEIKAAKITRLEFVNGFMWTATLALPAGTCLGDFDLEQFGARVLNSITDEFGGPWQGRENHSVTAESSTEKTIRNPYKGGDMNAKTPQPPCEEVLSAFAVEPKHDSETLRRYLKAYPQYAVEIASLSHELSRKIEKAPLSEKDKAAIDAAWKKHATAISVRPDDVFPVILPVPAL